MVGFRQSLGVALTAWVVRSAALGANGTNGTIATTESTSLTLLYQNNLNSTDDVNHVPFLVLDPTEQSKAASACDAFSETLLPDATLKSYASDIQKSLGYLVYAGLEPNNYFVASGVLAFNPRNQSISVKPASYGQKALPVLCTDNQGNAEQTALSTNEISISSGTSNFVGYRDRKSFRFEGIPYADPVARFEYSQLRSAAGENVQATAQGSECPQTGAGNEDCLFLSVYTPYLPKKGSTKNLKPVFFWIHGGGFTGGSGSQTDGGNQASREDIVFVSINYRLSTLGFLAVPGTDIKGNYGIADQITALKWVQQNIAAFGGDPDKITIVGESAGAGSVRVLLGSPPAIGNFRGAISMSNLGGGVDLGLQSTYSTSYSSYLTIEESYQVSKNLFADAGCTQSSLDAQVECIKAVPAIELVGFPDVARYVVQDGTYVNTPELVVAVKNASTAHVPVVFGVMHDDGASIGSGYPATPPANEAAGLQQILGIDQYYADAIISSGLFPLPNTGNFSLDVFNVSSRISTDNGFRCIDEATVYAGAVSDAFPTAYFYEFDRSIGGYDPNNVGNPPASPGYPRGNPSLPYFKVHAGDVESAFGTVSPDQIREPQDLWFAQLVSGYWAEFVRSLQPNPDPAYLKVRGYTETLASIQKSGKWEAIAKGSKQGPILALDWPAQSVPFRELEQCTWLNYTLTYYLDSAGGNATGTYRK